MSNEKKIPDRKDIVRIDCQQCNGSGFQYAQGGVQTLCSHCQGLGLIERQVPYEEGKNGIHGRDKSEVESMFGVKNPTFRYDPDSENK